MIFEALFRMLVGHAVADFGLQTDYIAHNKRRRPEVMAAHSLIHGGAVLVATGSYALAAVETCLHAMIDSYVRPDGSRPPAWLDQLLHAGCKAAYAAVLAIG